MHRFYFQRLGLCEEAGDTPAATAGGVETPKPAASGGEPDEGSEPEKPRASVVSGAISMFRDKGALQAEITTLKADKGALTAKVAKLETDFAAVEKERNELRSEFAKLEKALNEATANNVTREQAVTHALAEAGVPETALPAATGAEAAAASASASVEDQIADLNRKISETQDPKEKGRLANEAWDLAKKAGGAFKFSAN